MKKENNENAKLIEMAMAEIFNPKWLYIGFLTIQLLSN